MTAVRRLDVAMIALGTLDFLALGWLDAFQVQGTARHWVVFGDHVACLVFALEFVWNWQLSGWSRRFPLVNWYELVGMIPVASAVLRAFRLLRLIALLARRHRVAERITDRAFNARATDLLVERMAHTIVDATAMSIDRNRDRMEALLVEYIHNEPAVRRLRHLPFHNSVVRMIADASMRIMTQAMTDPRTDDFVVEVVRDNMNHIRVRLIAGSFPWPRRSRPATTLTLER